MTLRAIIISFLIALVANEVTGFSPWAARRLVAWAAKRTHGSTDAASVRAEEWAALVDARPGNLFKLFTAFSFVLGAVAQSSRNTATRAVAQGGVLLADLIALPFRSAVAARAREEGRMATAELWTAAGVPLVQSLSRLVGAPTTQERNNELERMMQLAVSAARARRVTGRDDGAAIRAVYYELTKDSLVCRYWDGRPIPPRSEFAERRSRNDDEVVRLAHGDDSLLVPDIDTSPPARFAGHISREYRSFALVPVKFDRNAYGVLGVDSDVANSLTEADVRYVAFIAGLLATGYAATRGQTRQR